MINIQLQDDSRNWVTYSTTMNSSAYITSAMEQLANRYPGKRVRATDNSGRIIDIL